MKLDEKFISCFVLLLLANLNFKDHSPSALAKTTGSKKTSNKKTSTQKADQEKAGTESTVPVESAKNQEEEISKLLIALGAALSSGEPAKSASFFSQDAIFIDQSGKQTESRKALEERFASLKETSSKKIALHPEKINLLAAGFASVVGTASKVEEKTVLPESRFSLLLQKQNGKWLIKQATETTMQAEKASDHLQQLAWLIGKWKVESTTLDKELEANWGAGKNFIIAKTTNNAAGSEIDMQIIGFDPRKNTIVSWHFDCNGGFGYASWQKLDGSWLLDYAGVLADGRASRAKNIFIQKGPAELSWQSVEQESEGEQYPDTETLILKKLGN